jgi:T4-like virus tail tube protein gp19
MATRNQINPPPLRKITDFKSKLTGGGARANLFEVELAFPSQVQVDGINEVLEKSRFLVKAANLPASNVAQIEVPFRGRTLKIAGDRSFDSWTVTVINDTDFSIRSAFEKWMNTINRVSDNTGLTDPASYQADAFVYQLDRDGSVLRTYHFYDVFPTQVTAIELSYDATGIQDFQVELQVQWWEAQKGTSQKAGGENIN